VYGRASAVVTNLPIVGGILACGVFLILISILGLIGAIKHHQVLLFFVSFNLMRNTRDTYCDCQWMSEAVSYISSLVVVWASADLRKVIHMGRRKNIVRSCGTRVTYDHRTYYILCDDIGPALFYFIVFYFILNKWGIEKMKTSVFICICSWLSIFTLQINFPYIVLWLADSYLI
jgi:hypothetical protein